MYESIYIRICGLYCMAIVVGLNSGKHFYEILMERFFEIEFGFVEFLIANEMAFSFFKRQVFP